MWQATILKVSIFDSLPALFLPTLSRSNCDSYNLSALFIIQQSFWASVGRIFEATRVNNCCIEFKSTLIHPLNSPSNCGLASDPRAKEVGAIFVRETARDARACNESAFNCS
ncbi:hypothetical protein EJ07DRAFT_152048 [Lizonia empirigonia]|nr:hypothetical protein EJ07DRAFT_152048 [Lizonia empirigonia]